MEKRCRCKDRGTDKCELELTEEQNAECISDESVIFTSQKSQRALCREDYGTGSLAKLKEACRGKNVGDRSSH